MDEDTDFFNIVARVLHGDTLASYLLIICLDYVLRTSIDLIIIIIKKRLYAKKKNARSKQYLAETKADADYADDRALLANISTQAEFQWHSLKMETKWSKCILNEKEPPQI